MKNVRKVLFYGAMSVDGYLAGENHELDWLMGTEGEEETGFAAFYESVDTLLLGRKTYEQVLKLAPDAFPYPDKKCYVLSRTLKESNEYTDIIGGDILSLVQELKGQQGKHIWIVGGGELLHSLLKEDVVDELILQVAPVLIGKGIPLFHPSEHETKLQLLEVNRYKQLAELHFVIKKERNEM
ncbi:dihydrofolate reductase family protein [Bacillus sp. NPDC077027]|uniref:dihydrofolate reductase family protein n=1 Tax=Bacillus sp. NPDC077027 TaxID=3390548 RepID=UPI003CFEFF04